MHLISVNEAATRLGLSPLTIRRLIRRGDLPHVRPTGRSVRIPEDAIADFIARRVTKAEGVAR